MRQNSQLTPRIAWGGTARAVRLPTQDGNVLEAKWNPGLTYVVRIREAGAAAWSLGFESPLTHFSFADLKPGTEYEVQVRALGPRAVVARRNPPKGPGRRRR